jgi:RNA exonuclease 1
MCYTAAGLEVTRCSVVDAAGAVVYDSLILPHAPITDYNTQHSGITAEQMAHVRTRLGDCQAALLRLVAEETLLVGHSLENDLHALKLLHRSAVDTSLLYPHPRGPPFKPALRVLAERLLQQRIQDGSHDSVADARASMALARLKFAKGPAFGEQRQEGVPMLQLLSDGGRRATLVERPKALQRLVTAAASAVQCQSDADGAAKAAREAQRAGGPHLTYLGLNDLSQLQEATAQRQRRRLEAQLAAEAEGGDAAAVAAAAAQEEQQESERRAAVLREADAHVAQLLASAAKGTLVVLLSAQGDAPAARRLLEQKFRRNQGLSGRAWGDSDEAALTAATGRAKNGLVFVKVV